MERIFARVRWASGLRHLGGQRYQGGKGPHLSQQASLAYCAFGSALSSMFRFGAFRSGARAAERRARGGPTTLELCTSGARAARERRSSGAREAHAPWRRPCGARTARKRQREQCAGGAGATSERQARASRKRRPSVAQASGAKSSGMGAGPEAGASASARMLPARPHCPPGEEAVGGISLNSVCPPSGCTKAPATFIQDQTGVSCISWRLTHCGVGRSSGRSCPCRCIRVHWHFGNLNSRPAICLRYATWRLRPRPSCLPRLARSRSGRRPAPKSAEPSRPRAAAANDVELGEGGCEVKHVPRHALKWLYRGRASTKHISRVPRPIPGIRQKTRASGSTHGVIAQSLVPGRRDSELVGWRGQRRTRKRSGDGQARGRKEKAGASFDEPCRPHSPPPS